MISDKYCSDASFFGTNGLSSTSTTLDVEEPYLLITVNNEHAFQWFKITQLLLEHITVELLMKKIDDFFDINVSDQILNDRFGLINTTSDLRRSLSSSRPVIHVTTWEEEFRTCPNPIGQIITVKLTREHKDEKFGFTNVLSNDRERLIVSEIIPGSLVSGRDIELGDSIIRVNGKTAISEMS